MMLTVVPIEAPEHKLGAQAQEPPLRVPTRVFLNCGQPVRDDLYDDATEF